MTRGESGVIFRIMAAEGALKAQVVGGWDGMAHGISG